MSQQEIEVSVWWKSGTMMYRRDSLPPEHPESTYNYIKREYGVDPEVYGAKAPGKRCPMCHQALEEL